MKDHEIEEKLTELAFKLLVLERNSARHGSDIKDLDGLEKLLIAVEMTIEVLERWKRVKATCMEDDGYDDYREVVSTLPILKEAWISWVTRNQ